MTVRKQKERPHDRESEVEEEKKEIGVSCEKRTEQEKKKELGGGERKERKVKNRSGRKRAGSALRPDRLRWNGPLASTVCP